MNIEDVKIGTRVTCLDDDTGVITTGALGTIIQDNDDCPYISWDVKFSEDFFEKDGYQNVYALWLNEIEVVEKVEQPPLSKLTVTISDEDKEEIANYILKIVLQDLNVIIADAIVSLSNDSLSNDSLSNDSLSNDTLSDGKDDELTGFDTSDEKLQHLLDEATKDVMKEIIREQITSLNKQAFNI